MSVDFTFALLNEQVVVLYPMSPPARRWVAQLPSDLEFFGDGVPFHVRWWPTIKSKLGARGWTLAEVTQH